jgi:aryl-alcohol dehydrogenase-like predicted oxidoreductase
MERDFERDIIPMARHFGMALCPWGVLGGAQLQTTKQLEERAKNNEGGRSAGQTEQARKVSAALERIAKEHGIDSIQQIALAYVRQKAKNVNVIPLIGGRKVEHLQNNIAALSIRLTDEQISEIENIKEFEIGFPMNFISGDPRLGFQRSPLLESLVGAKIDYSI